MNDDSCPATNQRLGKDRSGAVAGSISSQELPRQLIRRCNTSITTTDCPIWCLILVIGHERAIAVRSWQYVSGPNWSQTSPCQINRRCNTRAWPGAIQQLIQRFPKGIPIVEATGCAAEPGGQRFRDCSQPPPRSRRRERWPSPPHPAPPSWGYAPAAASSAIETGGTFPSGTVPWPPLESAEEVEVYEI